MATLPGETRVGRIGLSVGAIEGIADFYQTVVGLERMAGPGDITFGAGDMPLLSLTSRPDLAPRPTRSAGLFHAAFRVPNRPALADALARIRAANALSGASDHHVSEALYLSDPESNGIEVYCDRPRSSWERTDDGVKLVTEPLALDELSSLETGQSRVPAGTDIGHVHFEVTDLARSRHFYVDTLGFDIMATTPGALFVAAGGYHHHIGLNTWNRASDRVSGRGLDYVELVLPDETARSQVLSRLEDANKPVQERDDAVQVFDPDGIELRLLIDPTDHS